MAQLLLLLRTAPTTESKEEWASVKKDGRRGYHLPGTCGQLPTNAPCLLPSVSGAARRKLGGLKSTSCGALTSLLGENTPTALLDVIKPLLGFSPSRDFNTLCYAPNPELHPQEVTLAGLFL
ncbi:UNVERIFIED_CONTAM: hypothetical protein K2H54_060877 [Gekko kuhli]